MDRRGFDVFLSYNHRDEAMVERIAEALRTVGLTPWLAKWSIKGGEPFPQAIDKGLSASSSYMVFVGPAGMSRWVDEEVGVAINIAQKNSNFRVIPVLLPGLPSDYSRSGWPGFLAIRQAIDLRSGIGENGIQKLVTALLGSEDQSVVRDLAGTSRLTKGRTGGSTGATTGPIGSVTYLDQNVALVQQHVRMLTFTPVIGPGCSLIGRSHGAAWAALGRRLRHLLDSLEDGGPAAAYVRGLAAVPVYDVAVPGSVAHNERHSLDDALYGLQVALVHLGADLGAAFARSMQGSSAPVWDAARFAVRAPRDAQITSVVTRLIDACLAAHSLRAIEAARDPRIALGAGGIYDRLVELAADLTGDAAMRDLANRGSATPAVDDLKHDLQRLHRAARGPVTAGGVEFSITQLEWIADALWHTLRYDAPAYPRADELAFQIALLASGIRGARPELVAAAEVGRFMLSAATVASWFQRYAASPATEMLHFYDSIARILAEQFDGFRAAGDRTADSGGQPVAFSTTYDLELENALHRETATDAFHVVVPVQAYLEDDDQPELRWLIGTVRRHHAPGMPVWRWFDKDEIPRPQDVEGPLVIKVHGSPLHHLPSPRDIVRRGHDGDVRHIEHALILSESEYLQNIVWKDPLPRFFNNVLLQRKRGLFFLGHSLGQWSARLRLFSHVFRPSTPSPRTADQIAIGRTLDPHRSAVLGALGIHRVIGDLEEIPPLVEAVLQR